MAKALEYSQEVDLEPMTLVGGDANYLDGLSKDIDKAATPEVKVPLLLRYLEHYCDHGGTIRKWAESRFRYLCEILESVDLAPETSERLGKLAPRLSEILQVDLSSLIPQNFSNQPEFKLGGRSPRPDLIMGFVNYVMLSAPQSFSVSEKLSYMAENLMKAGIPSGLVSQSGEMRSWSDQRINSTVSEFLKKCSEEVPKQNGLKVFSAPELKELGFEFPQKLKFIQIVPDLDARPGDFLTMVVTDSLVSTSTYLLSMLEAMARKLLS